MPHQAGEDAIRRGIQITGAIWLVAVSTRAIGRGRRLRSSTESVQAVADPLDRAVTVLRGYAERVADGRRGDSAPAHPPSLQHDLLRTQRFSGRRQDGDDRLEDPAGPQLGIRWGLLICRILEDGRCRFGHAPKLNHDFRVRTCSP